MGPTGTKQEVRSSGVGICAIALSLTLVLGTAQAELIPIDVDGDTMIDVVYDSTTDLSWMADAALYATNPFGLPISPGLAALDWETANAWLAAMNAAEHLGVNDWRLPTVSPVNGSSFVYVPEAPGQTFFNGTIDQIANITSPASELSYLYYVSLENVGFFPLSGTPTSPPGYSVFPRQGPFVNFFGVSYWTGTPYEAPSCSTTVCVWAFEAAQGIQAGAAVTGSQLGATWPVRTGRVPVPEADPSALLLGVVGLFSVLARKSRPSAS